MDKNMSNLDRIIRIGIAALFLLTIVFGWVSVGFAIVLGIIALVFTVTGVIGFCPLYKLLHMSTKKS
ncbi:MAG: YgaP family membrane protein [Anaerolineae bacterium]